MRQNTRRPAVSAEAVAYGDEALADMRCRATIAEASLALVRSELLTSIAECELHAATAGRHRDLAGQRAWQRAANAMRETMGRVFG